MSGEKVKVINFTPVVRKYKKKLLVPLMASLFPDMASVRGM